MSEEGARAIEEQWTLMSPSEVSSLADLEQLDEEMRGTGWGQNLERNAADARWGYLNERRLREGRAGDWGLYRNTGLQMAAILEFEGRLKGALTQYLEVSYLDINGPQNIGKNSAGQPLPGENPAFAPGLGYLAPGVVKRVSSVAQRLGLGENDVSNEFLSRANRICEALHLSVTPTSAWAHIRDSLDL